VIVINPKNTDFNNPILSKDKTAAITISDSGFFFLNLKTKQGKIIGKTRAEAIQHLKDMDKIDDFPDF
jgi:hypothetical protein